MNIIQTHEGRKTVNAATLAVSDQELVYQVYNYGTINDALLAVLAEAPAVYNNLYKKNITFNGFKDDGLEFTVAYDNRNIGAAPNGESTQSTMSFDCGGGTKKVVMARSQTVYNGETSSSADNVPIGWNGKYGQDAEFSGVEIPIGNIRMTFSRIMKMSKLSANNNQFLRNAADLSGKVNSAEFKGWAAGEVMFIGYSFSGSLDGNALIPVQFNFQVQRREENAIVGGIEIGTKEGFWYAWATPKQKVFEGTAMEMKADRVYVAEVVEGKDFSILGV